MERELFFKEGGEFYLKIKGNEDVILMCVYECTFYFKQ